MKIKNFAPNFSWVWFFASILSLLVIPLYTNVISKEILELPDNFNYTAGIISTDNFFDQKSGEYLGDQQSVTKFSYETIDFRNSNLLIRNSFDVRTPSGQKIFSTSRLYGIHQSSKTHVPSLGDKQRSGFLFAPRMKGITRQVADKSPFTYWHVNYDVPIQMEFRQEESLYGLDVYRYESNFSADQTKDLQGTIDGVGTKLGILLDVRLQMWIEPVSGKMIKYQDSADGYFYDLGTGQRLYPWNKFSNQFEPQSVTENLNDAAIQKQIIESINFSVVAFSLFGALVYLYYSIRNTQSVKLFTTNIPLKVKLLVPPIFVMIYLVSLTSQVVSLEQSVSSQITKSSFNSEVEKTNGIILTRLQFYGGILDSARSLFYASSFVDKGEWNKFVTTLGVFNKYPGLQGIGYAAVQKTKTNNQVQIKVPVTYLEPANERNLRAMNFDMYSENVRRRAIDYARDSGELSLSGMVTLRQETDYDQQPGFLMYKAIYSARENIASVSARKQNVVGYVYIPFRMYDFVNGTLRTQSKLIIQIYDTADKTKLNDDTLLYSNEFKSQKYLNLSNISQIEYGGHTWTVVYRPLKEFENSFIANNLPFGLWFVGLFISVLLAVLTYILTTRRVAAMAYAEVLTKDLKSLKDNAEKLRTEAENRADESERLNRVMIDREMKMIELKEEIKKLKEGNSK